MPTIEYIAQIRQQSERITALEAESVALKAALKAAQDNAERPRAALQAVEWVGSGPHGYCAWCGRWKLQGHAPDCQRQAALAQTTQTSEVKA